jgi:hypothetical protein
MRRITLFISVALALLAFAIPATAGAKRSHHKSHHRVADRNHNGMPDRWEHKFRVHKASADPDRDGVANVGEFHNGTNPRDADTDNDGVEDGNDDANHDGIDDGDEQSGVVTSFDGTILTVTLVNGDTLKGTVDSGTEIECDDATPPTTTTATTRHDGESGDDNSGTGSTTSGSGDDDATEHQQGDDNSGTGTTTSGSGSDDNNEQGDDNDDQGENEGSCTTASLTPDTIVKEAELHLTSAGAVFDKIELGGKAPA